MNYDIEEDQETGLHNELPALSLDIPDRDLIQNFKRWEQDSQEFWNQPKEYDLKERRKRNVDYYLGKQIDKSKLYDFQVPYIDNELFVATQVVSAYITSSNPTAEVRPENDSPQSKIMADELEFGLDVHSEMHDLAAKIKQVALNAFLKYVGVLKLYWDDAKKDIVPTVVDPEKIVFDRYCKQGENPLFISETCEATFQQLLNMFPEKKEEIMKKLNRTRMSAKLQNSIYVYKEVWFTQIDDDGETECVAWYMDDLILDKAKNPNFLYDRNGVQIVNAPDCVRKPYVLFNFVNDGEHLIDRTSQFEQAIPQQDILNKIGRQIIENADTANSVLVVRSNAITKETAENITRNPKEILLLNVERGEALSNAYGTIDPHLLPNYVLNLYQQAKNAIHEAIGTPAQFRGSDDKRNVGTLGEAQMMRAQASGRQDDLVLAIERGLDSYYKLLANMMKVYYKEPKFFSCRDNDGKFVQVELSRERIPDNAWVSVEHGSTVKQDKNRQENIAMTLAQMGLIDPYNLYKMIHLKNPDKLYETLVKFRMSPDSLSEEVRAEQQNRLAYIDFACIMNGEDVAPHDDVDSEHILAHRAQITTDKFLYAKPERQKAMVAHIQGEVFKLSQRVKLEEASMQGLLVDPNMPVTPEVPEPMPQPPMQPQLPPEAMMGQGQPQMPPMGAQQAPQGAPAPMMDMAQGPEPIGQNMQNMSSIIAQGGV